VEVIADREAAARVDPALWQRVCGQVGDALVSSDPAAGLVAAIETMNVALEAAFPATAGDRDELPDRPRIL
ncbi:MAG: TPM domain-containing protein, partial [Burkholderiaceae bacterium]